MDGHDRFARWHADKLEQVQADARKDGLSYGEVFAGMRESADLLAAANPDLFETAYVDEPPTAAQMARGGVFLRPVHGGYPDARR